MTDKLVYILQLKKLSKENTVCAKPVAKATADVDPVFKKVKLSVRVKNLRPIKPQVFLN